MKGAFALMLTAALLPSPAHRGGGKAARSSRPLLPMPLYNQHDYCGGSRSLRGTESGMLRSRIGPWRGLRGDGRSGY
ncbi:MAG: hypothetical protein ACLVB5_15460 [Christensenellales bacterium]